MKTLLVILQAVWLGAHITVGYVVAPLLFHFASRGEISRMTAGNVAGELFHVLMYFGLFTAVVWWLFCRSVRQPSKILNVLLLYLITYKTTNRMKDYRRILLQNCLIDMLFNFVNIITKSVSKANF